MTIIHTGKDMYGLLQGIGRKEQVCLIKIQLQLQPRHQVIRKIKSRSIVYIPIHRFHNLV